jgi:transposase
VSSGTARLCPVYPSSTTDAQWRLLEPLLPPAGNTGGKGGRNEKYSRRLVLDAIFYLVSDGIAWRALPWEFLADGVQHLPPLGGNGRVATGSRCAARPSAGTGWPQTHPVGFQNTAAAADLRFMPRVDIR